MIELRQVTVERDGCRLLDSVDLKVTTGEHVVVGGPNGSGKSTLVLTILGVHVPNSGSVRINGSLMDARNLRAIRREIAYVDQEPILAPGPASEALLRPFSFAANRDNRPNRSEINSALASVGLGEEILSKESDVLSGGEKQRLCVARALLLRRKILIVDEINSALDETSAVDLLHLVREQNATVLAVSHHPEWLAGFDRVIRMESGTVHA